MELVNEPILIRDGVPSDYEGIADLTTGVYVGEAFSPVSAEDVLRDIARRHALSDVLVAEDKGTGQVIGAISLVRDGEMLQVAGDGECELRLLAVDPSSRGRGVGRALVEECIFRAKTAHARAIVLSTQSSMKSALRIYSTLGFERAPELDWQTPDGRRMLGYRLDLISPR
jgi:ribosomal protein S18 acetylase RimI-like enzyme